MNNCLWIGKELLKNYKSISYCLSAGEQRTLFFGYHIFIINNSWHYLYFKYTLKPPEVLLHFAHLRFSSTILSGVPDQRLRHYENTQKVL